MTELHPNGMRRYPEWQPSTPFEHWWVENDMDSDPDAHFTVSEQVWNAAQRVAVDR